MSTAPLLWQKLLNCYNDVGHFNVYALLIIGSWFLLLPRKLREKRLMSNLDYFREAVSSLRLWNSAGRRWWCDGVPGMVARQYRLPYVTYIFSPRTKCVVPSWHVTHFSTAQVFLASLCAWIESSSDSGSSSLIRCFFLPGLSSQ